MDQRAGHTSGANGSQIGKLYGKSVRMSLMSQTLNILVSEKLLDRLGEFVRQTNRRRNSVIVRAIEDYLDLNQIESLRAEARRQSLLASKQTQPEDEAWPELAADDTGWK